MNDHNHAPTGDLANSHVVAPARVASRLVPQRHGETRCAN